jgi:hypothetical protein
LQQKHIKLEAVAERAAEHGEVTDVHRRNMNADSFEERAEQHLESTK